MPGLVTKGLAKTGATVQQGEALVVLEALKREHTLRAPRDGVVAEIVVQVNQQVSHGDVLIVLEDGIDG